MNIFFKNFLGDAPSWYKATLLIFLVINPILFFFVSPFIAGWALIAEFIFTLALALKCYPLPSGGLLALEAVIIGMVSPASVYREVSVNLPVILLLMFMVAGIHFMKDSLLFIFTKLVVSVKSKVKLSLIFCFLGAFLSAFLDALTVTAVIIAVAYGFYGIYHSYASKDKEIEIDDDSEIDAEHALHLENLRGFLRNLLMHGAVGTALGGAMTLVGEPQNLLIGEIMAWSFKDFFVNCAPISIPVAITGLVLCYLLERYGVIGYGYKLPDDVRAVLEENVKEKTALMDKGMYLKLAVQWIVGILLILALAFHLAQVGLIGLGVIILITSFNGVIDEHSFGESFMEGLPFTALLVVFFSIVAIIHELHLFTPIINYVLDIEGDKQLVAFFASNGILSTVSDNVFVASIYITELQKAFLEGAFSGEWYSKLAVAVNMGTNIPSISTPNGQAAFLFLLTSSVAPLIKLSYLEMVKLALPYAVTLTSVGLLCTLYIL